ncbi:PLP-dependent transferase [Streptomyces sp. CA-288835]|uniref:PLP-dependent transferase n=1 Tax=Streptomyces sp. CA-288835 TaxID=3240069 RepID=UPI003D94290B
MDTETLLIHAARQAAAAAHSVSPPLMRTSTTVFDSFDAYKQAQNALVFDGPRYGRSGTSTTFELQRAMAWFRRWERTTFVGGFRKHLAITRVGNVDEK